MVKGRKRTERRRDINEISSERFCFVKDLTILKRQDHIGRREMHGCGVKSVMPLASARHVAKITLK